MASGAARSDVARPAVPPSLSLVGPTASGKSALAIELARRRISSGRPVELLSVDSMAVYRGMDIGTASPTPADRAAVPHHLVDLVDPDHEFSVAEFRAAADLAMIEIRARGAGAVLVGGTGLYHQAIVDSLELPGRFPEVAAALQAEPDTSVLYARLVEADPLAAARIEPDNRRRIVRALEVTVGSGRAFSSYGPGLDAHPPTPYVLAGLQLERPVLHARIEARFRAQMDAGLLDEVRMLAARPEGISRTAAQALGYRELLEHLHGDCSLDEAVSLAIRRTQQFAVRQIRWFRRDPRITWFDAHDDVERLADDLDDFWSSRG